MNDEQIRRLLRKLGYSEHVWREGREGLIRSWRTFVAQVERGYPLGLDDYRNDLDLRAAIAAAGLDDEVRDADERFRQMLTATDRRLWESSAADAFWDFGYPKNAAGDLLDDLKAEGMA